MNICKSSGSDNPEVKMAFLFYHIEKFFESRQAETETFLKTSLIKTFNQGRASDSKRAADADLWPATKQKLDI